jgi:hypothetical protein
MTDPDSDPELGPALVGVLLVVFATWFAYTGVASMAVVCLGLLVVESLGVVVLG